MDSTPEQKRKEAIKLIKDALGRAENIIDHVEHLYVVELEELCSNLDDAIVLLS